MRPPLSHSFSLRNHHHLYLPRSLPTASHSTFGGGGGDVWAAGSGMIGHMVAPSLEVKELEELPEQWRRTKLALFCKELPALNFGSGKGRSCPSSDYDSKFSNYFNILDAASEWLRQEDATYAVVHGMRIGESEAAFRVYQQLMMHKHWYRFDFALATKLAESLGKEGMFEHCLHIFNEIINKGHVPCESTFHILMDAYLGVPDKGRLHKACCIYNGMIHPGGYKPRLNVHNSLFRALISKLGVSSKHYLKQAEFIFHNLVTSGLEIQKDIYVGLIWLHSYQGTVNKERIASLREEMRRVGIEEGKEVLLSIMRVYSKEGDVEEVETVCRKLLDSDDGIPTQAFVYKMIAYAKIGEFTKSLDTFREMRKLMGSATFPEYRDLIEVLCKAESTKLAESVMDEFGKSCMKPPLIVPSYINITDLNLGMRDRLHLAFYDSEYENILVYNIYLESLIKAGNVEKAEEVFNQMQSDEAIGIDARSCNTMLIGYLSSCNTISSGYLASEKYNKVDELFHLMIKKDYDVKRGRLARYLDYVLMMVRKDLVNLV
ncbi:hypothetical protein Ddye_003741 [Dipteronia dyeriana]|uniref:Pentatricopeptide repeat-containing protein n=1 Tax=Dipteronia dyeriana TaxID=168575 RepID=A0AAD9XTE1_9ROSI|nr:hypothetical protein Ddye_003741 [Dipteronia dyeriana]